MKSYLFRENEFHGDNYFNFTLYDLKYFDRRINLIDKHWHEELEFLYINQGCVRLLFDGEYSNLSGKTLVYLPSGVKHKLLSLGSEKIQIYSLVFSKKLIGIEADHHSYFNSTSLFNHVKICPLEEKDFSNVELLIQEIILSYSEKINNGELLIRGNLFLIFYNLFKNENEFNKSSMIEENKNDYRLEVVTKFVKENLQKNITLSIVANLVNLHPSYFCSLFKKEYGVTFFSYLTEIRMNKARLLLRTTNLAIIDISFACGFSSNQYFSTLFKKKFHISPKKYRDKYKLNI